MVFGAKTRMSSPAASAVAPPPSSGNVSCVCGAIGETRGGAWRQRCHVFMEGEGGGGERCDNAAENIVLPLFLLSLVSAICFAFSA